MLGAFIPQEVEFGHSLWQVNQLRTRLLKMAINNGGHPVDSLTSVDNASVSL
jgi:hypothetical protein